MKFLALFALLPLVLSAPTQNEEAVQEHQLAKRLDTSSHCGQWDAIVAGQYTLYLDQASISPLSAPLVSTLINFDLVPRTISGVSQALLALTAPTGSRRVVRRLRGRTLGSGAVVMAA